MRASVHQERSRRDSSQSAELSAPWLLVKELRSRREIAEYFRVRHNVYVDSGYIQPRPSGLDIDPYDAHCRFLGAFDLRLAGSPLIGGARMILAAGEPNREVVEHLAQTAGLSVAARPNRFMAMNAFDLDRLVQTSMEAGHTLVEFGRTACLRDYRSRGVGTALVQGIIGLGIHAGADQAVAVGPPSLRGYYESFGCRHLANRPAARFGSINSELECLVVDLASLVGPCRPAHQAAGQLRRYEHILMCDHRRCLDWHNHHPRFQSAVHVADRPPEAPGRGGGAVPAPHTLPVTMQLHDETLRSGLQSPSVRHPSLDEQREIVEAMGRLGTHYASFALPAGGRAGEGCTRLLQHALDRRIQPTLVGSDVALLLEQAQRCGAPLEVGLTVGCSQIRHLCEGADLQTVADRCAGAIRQIRRAAFPVMLILEDAARAHPEALRRFLAVAVDQGVGRVCLADTVGHATPRGVTRLVRFVRATLEERGADLPLNWHGCQDRGLALVNSLAAVEAGVERVHASALGMGNRVGDAPLEQVLLAVQRRGAGPLDAERLRHYLETVARHTQRPLPYRVHENLEHAERVPGAVR